MNKKKDEQKLPEIPIKIDTSTFSPIDSFLLTKPEHTVIIDFIELQSSYTV